MDADTRLPDVQRNDGTLKMALVLPGETDRAS